MESTLREASLADPEMRRRLNGFFIGENFGSHDGSSTAGILAVACACWSMQRAHLKACVPSATKPAIWPNLVCTYETTPAFSSAFSRWLALRDCTSLRSAALSALSRAISPRSVSDSFEPASDAPSKGLSGPDGGSHWSRHYIAYHIQQSHLCHWR